MRLIKEYCCCAIPILNAGIYVTLIEQFVVAVVAGILALVTPPIVGASTPSFVPDVFAALCFVAAGVQVFGFMGVFRESTIIFRRYTTLHTFIITAVFAFSAVFIGISASKHSTAQAKCVKDFFPTDPSSTATALTGSDSEGKLLCNIFTWVGVGTLGGLWVVLAIFHVYLFFVISGYGSSQRDDHSKYYSLYSVNSFPGQPGAGAQPTYPPVDHIGMNDMGHNADAWDSRGSMETVGFEKAQAQYQAQGSTYPPPQRQPSDATMYHPHGMQQPSDSTMYPGVARTMSPGPTPGYHNTYDDPYYRGAAPVGMVAPEPSARHPAEGSFHRKTPRASPAPSYGPTRQFSSGNAGNFDQSFFGGR